MNNLGLILKNIYTLMRIDNMLSSFSEKRSGNVLTLPNFTVVKFVLLFTMAITPLHAGDIYTEENLLTFYRYDKTQPFEAIFDTTGGGTPECYEIKVSFKSIHQERIPAMLYIPKKATPASPVPCVFWLHGYSGNKKIDKDILSLMAYYGYAVMSLDAQYHGERKKPTKDMYSLDLVQNRYAFAQTIIDHRRALDLVETIAEIDSDRIGLLGGSMGAILGALLAGVDDRIKAAVLVSGGGDWAEMIKGSDLKPSDPIRKYLRDNYQLVDRLLGPVDPINLIHRACAVQMHHGTEDITVPYATGLALFDRAVEPKEFHSYPGEDHYSISEGNSLILVVGRTINWFNQHL